MRAHVHTPTHTHQKYLQTRSVCACAAVLCFITGPFPPTNTQTGAVDKECTNSPQYTTSHLSGGNWNDEEKGEVRREVRGTADEEQKEWTGEWRTATVNGCLREQR